VYPSSTTTQSEPVKEDVRLTRDFETRAKSVAACALLHRLNQPKHQQHLLQLLLLPRPQQKFTFRAAMGPIQTIALLSLATTDLEHV
jgi:hypothetical protein